MSKTSDATPANISDENQWAALAAMSTAIRGLAPVLRQVSKPKLTLLANKPLIWRALLESALVENVRRVDKPPVGIYLELDNQHRRLEGEIIATFLNWIGVEFVNADKPEDSKIYVTSLSNGQVKMSRILHPRWRIKGYPDEEMISTNVFAERVTGVLKDLVITVGTRGHW